MKDVKICDVCNMMYCPDLAEDRAHHQRIHTMVEQGVEASLDWSVEVARVRGEDRIVAVDHNSAPIAEKKVAEQASWAAKQSVDRKAGFSWYRYMADAPADSKLAYHVFLYIKEQKAIGMVAMCRRPESVLGEWGEKMGTPDPTPRWCVEMVWVASLWRRQGIARLLAVEAASHLLTAPHLLAWSSPFTESGLALVKYFCPKKFYFR